MVVGMLGKSALKTTVLLTLSGLTIQMPSGYSNFTGFSNLVQSYSAGREASCIGGVVQTPVAANNTKILLSAPTTNAAVTEFYVELTQANSKIAATSVGGVNLVSGTYGIYTEVCFPANPVAAEKVATLQVLTHGGTLDHTYWDIAPGYSYVDAAVAAGYATLSYDRLGTGRSDHPDPVQIVQLPIQIEIVHALVQKARRGEIGGRSFDKVVGVGHSLGSGVTQGVAAKYIEDFNALILQGTSTNFNYALTGVASEDQHIASTDPSGRFRGLANGYHTPANTQFALQFAFYRYPNYDPNIFNLLTSNKQTNALGETFTLATAYAPATLFQGPVDIVNGENDYFYCGGDCNYPIDQAAAAIPAYFPSASKTGSQSFLAPNAGHNVNAHYSAKQAFSQMLAFLKSNGIS